MSEIRPRLAEVAAILTRVREASRFEREKSRLGELESRMAEEGFWGRPEEERTKVIQERKRANLTVTSIEEAAKRLADAEELLALAEEEKDAATLADVETESRKLLRAVEKLELRALLSGRYDAGNAFVSIQAGLGGTDACDWVTMLKRMLLRWSEGMGYEVSVIDELPGEETGLKSFAARVVGPYAYGYLRSEHGVHRLVRISPFDAQQRRQTSFASVDVSPEVEDVEIEISDGDLRVDTYRSSGAGGQHVNTTDSAVRITHLPTGVVVQCQNERSQHANRAQAMRVLQSRLVLLEERKREEELARESGAKRDIAFGSQIRSYVLHPYKLVKDLRTDYETSDVEAVLGGDLQPFIETWLREKARGAEK